MRNFFTIILVVLCLFCACSNKPVPANDTRLSSREQAGVNDLINKNYDYNFNHIDSLPVKAKWLRSLGDKYHIDSLNFYGNLFQLNYLYQSGNYVSAMDLALKVLDEAVKLKKNKTLPQIYALIGNLDKENMNYPMALQAAGKGLDAAIVNKDTAKIIALKGLQAMFTNSLSLDKKDSALQQKAITMQFEALRIAESNPKYEDLRIRFYDNISQYYFDVGQYEKSIEYGKKGVVLSLKHDAQRSLTYSYDWIGMSYYNLGQQQLGMDYLNKALQITQRLKQPYRTREIFRSMYECYLISKNYKDALQCYSTYNRINDSLKLANTNRQVSELQVQYDAVKKDAKIETLTASDNAKNRKIIYAAIVLCIVIALSAFIFKQYLTISNTNRQMAITNKTIQDQAEKLQVLMKELHHRVKNNLQIVSSLLTLQLNRLNDEESRNAIKLGQQRIEAMSLIHRSLYQQDNPTLVNMKEYITDLTESIMMSFGVDKNAFHLHLDIAITELDVDVAMPLGLIINEWVTNAFKHAYKMTRLEPALWIKLSLENSLELQIKDNGSGLPAEAWDRPQKSFGIKLVKVLTKQLRGTCTVENHEGTILTLQIPKTEIKQLLSA